MPKYKKIKLGNTNNKEKYNSTSTNFIDFSSKMNIDDDFNFYKFDFPNDEDRFPSFRFCNSGNLSDKKPQEGNFRLSSQDQYKNSLSKFNFHTAFSTKYNQSNYANCFDKQIEKEAMFKNYKIPETNLNDLDRNYLTNQYFDKNPQFYSGNNEESQGIKFDNRIHRNQFNNKCNFPNQNIVFGIKRKFGIFESKNNQNQTPVKTFGIFKSPKYNPNHFPLLRKNEIEYNNIRYLNNINKNKNLCSSFEKTKYNIDNSYSNSFNLYDSGQKISRDYNTCKNKLDENQFIRNNPKSAFSINKISLYSKKDPLLNLMSKKNKSPINVQNENLEIEKNNIEKSSKNKEENQLNDSFENFKASNQDIIKNIIEKIRSYLFSFDKILDEKKIEIIKKNLEEIFEELNNLKDNTNNNLQINIMILIEKFVVYHIYSDIDENKLIYNSIIKLLKEIISLNSDDCSLLIIFEFHKYLKNKSLEILIDYSKMFLKFLKLEVSFDSNFERYVIDRKNSMIIKSLNFLLNDCYTKLETFNKMKNEIKEEVSDFLEISSKINKIEYPESENLIREIFIEITKELDIKIDESVLINIMKINEYSKNEDEKQLCFKDIIQYLEGEKKENEKIEYLQDSKSEINSGDNKSNIINNQQNKEGDLTEDDLSDSKIKKPIKQYAKNHKKFENNLTNKMIKCSNNLQRENSKIKKNNSSNFSKFTKRIAFQNNYDGNKINQNFQTNINLPCENNYLNNFEFNSNEKIDNPDNSFFTNPFLIKNKNNGITNEININKAKQDKVPIKIIISEKLDFTPNKNIEINDIYKSKNHTQLKNNVTKKKLDYNELSNSQNSNLQNNYFFKFDSELGQKENIKSNDISNFNKNLTYLNPNYVDQKLIFNSIIKDVLVRNETKSLSKIDSSPNLQSKIEEINKEKNYKKQEIKFHKIHSNKNISENNPESIIEENSLSSENNSIDPSFNNIFYVTDYNRNDFKNL